MNYAVKINLVEEKIRVLENQLNEAIGSKDKEERLAIRKQISANTQLLKELYKLSTQPGKNPFVF